MADHLLSKYKASCRKYEWLRIRTKGARGHPDLNAYLRDEKACHLYVCRVSVPEGFNNEPTKYILSSTTKILLDVVLQYINDGRSHTIGINSGLKIIYDCMETHELIHNVQNLNKCCGPNKKFLNFVISLELKCK